MDIKGRLIKLLTNMPTVKELKEELKEKGLKVSGNKDELIERLENQENGTVCESCGKEYPAGKIDLSKAICPNCNQASVKEL